MSNRLSTQSQRVMRLRPHRQDTPSQTNPLAGEQTLDNETKQSYDMRLTEAASPTSLAEQDPYYMARATAGGKYSGG